MQGVRRALGRDGVQDHWIRRAKELHPFVQMSIRGQVGTVVQVEIDGDVRQCARDTLHLRHWVTKAFFGLTNDRKQYAALNKALLALELSSALTALCCAAVIRTAPPRS